MRILVCDGLEQTGVGILRAAHGVTVDERPALDKYELAEIIGEYDGLIVRSKTKVTAELIERASRLRVIGRAGTGVDNIDVPAATRRGIVVMNAAAGNTVTTAEHTWAMLMALARQIPQADASMKAGRWEKKRFMGVELLGKTLGIIGLGRIGSTVAERARAFGMTVVGFDPYFTEEAAGEMGIEMKPLDELFERADFITVHTPMTPETRGIINAAAIEKMKPGVRLINCVRGAVNMPAVSGELLAVIGPYITLGEKIGLFQGQVFGHDLREVVIEYSGDVADYDHKPITQAILAGFLRPVIERVNMVNAAIVAEQRGIKVTESRSRKPRDFASMIKVTALTGDAESEVAGALFGRREGRIVRINGFNLEALPKGHMILLFNRDEPGVLGRVASFIGEQHVNISRLYLGRKKIGENAVALIQLDQKMSEEGVRGLEKLTGVISVKQVEL